MSALVPGQLIGRYRIDARLGTGGMGEVFRAWDTTLRRPVALKVILAKEGAADATPDLLAARRARFLREARAAAGLRHPAVVTVFDVGEFAGTPYIAMELLEGTPLAALVGQPIAIERALRWLGEIAGGLAAAHRAGLVHRDVKPDNVIVCQDDSIKILDFGIAKTDGPEMPPAAAADASVASFRTGHGILLGTPRYMAPEQAAGLPIDPRADQFAWGLVAYELLCARHPSDVKPGFSGEGGWRDPAEPALSLRPALPPAIAEVIGRALERRAEARFPSMDPIVLALAPFSRAPSAATGGGGPPPHPAAGPVHSYASTVSAPFVPPATSPTKGTPWAAVLVVSAALFAIGGAAIGYGIWRAQKPDAPPVATPANAPASVSAVPILAQADAAPAATHDAGAHVVVFHDAGPPRKPVHLGTRIMSLSQDYSDAAVHNAIDARVTALEKCLNDGGLDPSKVAGMAVNVNYMPSGKALSASVRCSDGVGCACLKPSFSEGMDFGPPKSGRTGTVFVTFTAR